MEELVDEEIHHYNVN